MVPAVADFWKRYRRMRPDTGREPFDVFSIGDTAESADEGVELILSGTKTATSALPEELAETGIPFAGALSVVVDGGALPRAVVETTRVNRIPFSEVAADFVFAYGEWDLSLTTWREKNRTYYRTVCRRLGIGWHEDRELVCEYFRLVFPVSHATGAEAS